MKRAAAGGVAGVLLAIGWWLLADDDSTELAPPPPTHVDVRTPDVAAPSREPAPVEAVPAVAAPVSAVGSAPPASSAAPASGVQALEVEVAASPFDTESSAEIDYAYRLLNGPDAGPHTYGAAADAFERCLKQNPHHARCQLGLVAAQRAFLTGDAGGSDDPPPPRLDDLRRQLNGRPTPLTDLPSQPSKDLKRHSF